MVTSENKETYPVPTPAAASGPAARPEKDKKSPAEKMRESYWEGLEVEAFRKGAGMEDKGGKDTGGMPAGFAEVMISTVNAQSQALTGLLTKIVEIQAGTKGPADNEQGQFMTYLVGEVKDMKTRLEGATPDPLAVIEETSKRIDSLTETMRKRMGLPEGMISGATGMESMKLTLEVENMRNQAQERQNQFDLAIKTMEHQWQKEDERWAAEFRLRADESRRGNENREKAISTLQDLAGSIIESIEAEPGGVAQSPASVPADGTGPVEKDESPNIPTSFTCDNCGANVAVAPGTLEGTCKSCDAEFDLRPVT